MATKLHACFDIGLLKDLEPKGKCWEGDSVTGLLLHWLQLREGSVINQLQQMTIQSYLSGGGGGGGGGERERVESLAWETLDAFPATPG